MERAPIFPGVPEETKGTFPLFRLFSSTTPVLSVFPPDGDPYGVAMTRAVWVAACEKDADLVMAPVAIPGFRMVVCRQAMGGADLSVSISGTGALAETCFLNGIPVPDDTPRPLSDGDVLAVGDWVIRVVVPSESQPGFEGDLASLPVLALLQACADQEVDNRLVVRTGNRTASVYFHQGRVVHAEFREPGSQTSGEAAFRQIIEISTGRFVVNGQSLTPAKRSLDLPLDKLFLSLFEAAETDFQTGETFDFTPGGQP